MRPTGTTRSRGNATGATGEKVHAGRSGEVLPLFATTTATTMNTITPTSARTPKITNGRKKSPWGRRKRTKSLSMHCRYCVFVTLAIIAFFVSFQLLLNVTLFSNTKQNITVHNNNQLAASSNIHNNITAQHRQLQTDILQLQSQMSILQAQQPIYVEDPQFFPFMIRDARHLVPTQPSPYFHIFDYVDIYSVKQGKARHSQLFHNAQLIQNAPCQVYSVDCYRLKIIQVFHHILHHYPHVRYYFYMEADNDLCVPMSQVQALALKEERYFINVGIGFSGWIMSRQFVQDFVQLYSNITIPSSNNNNKKPKPSAVNTKDMDKLPSTSSSSLLLLLNRTDATNITTAAAVEDEDDEEEDAPEEPPEIRPDVLASYYLTEKHAWTVTRQYWVSHTTLESLGVSSLTVKDRRRKDSGQRMNLDKHLPRCGEPRRGKWPLGRRPLDPRDRFGWDYFDYQVCPHAQIFPCEGPDQLAKLVAQDWKVAKESGAIAKLEKLERRRKEEEENAKKNKRDAAAKQAQAIKDMAAVAASARTKNNETAVAIAVAAANDTAGSSSSEKNNDRQEAFLKHQQRIQSAHATVLERIAHNKGFTKLRNAVHK